MDLDLKQQLCELETMTVGQMKDKYRQLFREETRSCNRQWLYRRLAWRIQSLKEGGLSDRAKRRALELARDVDLRIRPPKNMFMDTPENAPTSKGKIDLTWDERLPIPGTTLIREYKGFKYRVGVLSNGFEYAGKISRSLSAVAHAITGSHWNGFVFFEKALNTAGA